MNIKTSSITANLSYADVCLQASNSDDVFNKFKNIPEYQEALEHVTIEQGATYIDIINRDNSFLLQSPNIDKFKTNDLYGTPKICEYGNLHISPSTLRYIKVLSDLIKLFGNLNDFKIAEIGGGYGGQCKIITDYFNVKDYHIVDLYEVNGLTEKYLNKLNVKNVRISTYDKLSVENYDLVISNYAYTELDRPLQDVYKNKIIDQSKRGYITCNFVTHCFEWSSKFTSYSKDELVNLKNNTSIISEEPLTSDKNFILIW